ncbi:MAG: FtsQ-type POTRA domain-containing protein [Clostridia bacterium]|nr:FtsQ-type POTRA domain-containing protein [Clostridia bacterium]
MSRTANEKLKQKSTKDNNTFNLDNEIIIGLKTMPNQMKKSKQNKTKKQIPSSKRKRASKNKRIVNEKKRSKEQKNDPNWEIEEKKQYQTPRPKKNKKLTQKQELARKKRKAILRILKWTTLLGILTAGIIYFLLSPFFAIKAITVEGNQKISQEEIISLSQIQLEENTFRMRKDTVKQQIKQNAYIDTVSIKRRLPDGIAITVTERTPSFILTFANAYIYLSSQGYLLEITDKPLDLPIITGYQTVEEDLKAGNRLCKEDLQKLGEVLQIMESANSNKIANLITKINIENKNDYLLELASEKKTVHLGDTSQLSTKMLYIIKILEEEKKNEGEILVNTDLNNKGAIFREKV